ncbi:hypothetical protein ACTFIY_005918 [Dictyostelium cf. discoideum]
MGDCELQMFSRAGLSPQFITASSFRDYIIAFLPFKTYLIKPELVNCPHCLTTSGLITVGGIFVVKQNGQVTKTGLIRLVLNVLHNLSFTDSVNSCCSFEKYN